MIKTPKIKPHRPETLHGRTEMRFQESGGGDSPPPPVQFKVRDSRNRISVRVWFAMREKPTGKKNGCQMAPEADIFSQLPTILRSAGPSEVRLVLNAARMRAEVPGRGTPSAGP